jgi:hypothetical protein
MDFAQWLLPVLTNQQRPLFGFDELQGCQFKDVAFRELGVVRPVEVLQILALRQAREREAPIQQPRTASIELILHEPGEGLEEIHLVALDLHGSRLERCDHAREA